MFTLASGSGAQDYSVGPAGLQPDQWAKIRGAAVRMLRARGNENAAKLLGAWPFELLQGENFFQDDFVVLFARLDLEKYTRSVELFSDRSTRAPFGAMQRTIEEIHHVHVRFVAIAPLLDDGPEPVPDPELRLTSRSVTEALNDAQYLISVRGPTSGVDRAHTVLHGYLRLLCSEEGIDVPDDADLSRLFKRLRADHPKLKQDGPRGADITRALQALATVVGVLNPLRNRATLVHPNDELLQEPEAALVLNAIRTILHYLDQRLRQ